MEHARLSADDVVEIEIEGFVTSVDSATNFVINDVPVQIDATTTVEGGSADEIVEIPQGQRNTSGSGMHNGINKPNNAVMQA